MRIPAANESVWQSIGAAICENTGQPFAITNVTPVSGGCINKTVVIDDGLRSFFVKLNVAASAGMFEAETDGLRELDKAGALRVPQPVCHGSDGKHAWLVLEFLDLSGSSRPGAAQGWEQAGHALALTHRCRQRRYGWHRDNTIGSTPQINTCADDWVEFLRLQRIGMQLDLAARNGYRGLLRSRGPQLLDALPQFFADYTPDASLLHGDLWSGNIGFISGGQPVVFDPAVYYGDRETDIAMTELFGGFTRDFYRAYEAVWPLDRGYGVRKHLYNLYHLLNHLNLFGLGYLSQCEAAIDHLLAQLD
ncbi:MAG: fructosamine kinase family protein [Burkholderiales bacterium]|jgi:fructosamine-3-kinase